MKTDLLRVGRMPYLNSAVFYRYLPAGPWELTDMPPRAMASAVERGELQAGPLPVVEVFRLGDTLQPIGGLGVAATGPATSVLLFSRRPVERLAGSRVGLTSESATSVQLIRILFRDWWRVEPAEYVETDEPNDALLLIGDKALRARQRLSGYPYEYDLGEEWFKLTGLPFVFATWVARADSPRGLTDDFRAALETALKQGLSKVDEIAAETALFGQNAAHAASYIRHFTYRLGDEEIRGMGEFQERLKSLLPGIAAAKLASRL